MYRSPSRWHMRAWGTSRDQGSGERRCQETREDFEIELPGIAIPDDEFHDEPHLKEAKLPEEVPNAVRQAIMRVQNVLGHRSKELLCRALRIGGANKVAIRAATELECDVCSESKPPKTHLRAKMADTYTEFNQGVGVDLFMLADSDEQVFEFMNRVDLATKLGHLLSSAISKA